MPTTLPPNPGIPTGPAPAGPDLPPELPDPPPEKGPPDPVNIPSPAPDSIDDPLSPEPIGIPGMPDGDLIPSTPGAVVF